jgi:hypothetical protein
MLDEGPRSAALGGASAALGGDAVTARANAAGLALMGGPHVIAALGAATEAGVSHAVFGGGTMIEGMGLSALVSQTRSGSAYDRSLMLSIGLPVEELPWFSLGASLKYLTTGMKTGTASGFGFDASVMAHFGLPWQAVEVTVAAGIEDALASLKWDDGLTEDVGRQARLGAGIEAGKGLALLSEIRLIRGTGRPEGILAFGLEEAFRAWGIPAAVRMGWRDGKYREASFTGGFGVRYGAAAFNYALVGETKSLGWLNTASLTFEFGARLEPRTAGAISGYPVPLGGVEPEERTFVLTSPYRSMNFSVRAPRVGRSASWAVLFSDSRGEVVWSAEGEGAVPAVVEWNGGMMDGREAPQGVYSCQLVIRGPGTYQYLSRGATFRISRPRERRKDETEPEEPGGF